MYDRFLQGLAALGAVIMALMALWISYEVIMRYFFQNPTIWASDLAEYAMLYSTFLAAPWLVRTNGHVRVELLLDKLNERQQHVLGVVTSLLAAAVCAVLCWQGLDATIDAAQRGQMIARSWQVPRAAVWGIIPFGSFFLTIEFLRAAVRSAHAARTPGDGPDPLLDEPMV